MLLAAYSCGAVGTLGAIYTAAFFGSDGYNGSSSSLKTPVSIKNERETLLFVLKKIRFDYKVTCFYVSFEFFR